MSDIQSQDYHLVQKVSADGDIPISLHVNKITGLRIVTAYAEQPIVKGNMVLATEAFDDDGLPHTLEHLVFLGSEDYPYKGVLDLLANRSLASGTNALTDTDYTGYDISTAGKDGFLNLLPIYLDHILFPSLTDAAYTTEVHHINGDGEDAGVVYCEMQARENTGESRCYLELLRSMYPGKCGYSSETGGLLKNFRESTSNQKVRDYHKKFYHSKNLCIIVIGPIEAEEVIKVIKPIEDKIVQKGMHKIEFQRPWQTPVQPLAESITRKIQYPSDTEDDGLVFVGFRGPNSVTNYGEILAISVLLEYLNDTTISPIQRDFVECPEPYCSSTCHYIIENSISCIYLSFESVGKEYYDLVAGKLFDLLRQISSGQEKFDSERMHTILERRIVKILAVAEDSPNSMVMSPVVGHFLYGHDNLQERCQEIPRLEQFLFAEPHFWLNLIEKYFVGPSARYVCVVGEPNTSLMKTMSKNEKERLAKQKETLKDELPRKAEELKAARATNDIPAPTSMLSSIPIPSVDNITFHPIERVVMDKSKLPFRVQYDSIKTNFVTISLLMDTSRQFSKTDRLYFPLLSELLLESPIERNGEIIPYEKVVAELFKDTISAGTSVGIQSQSLFSVGAASMFFTVAMHVEKSKFEKAIQWFNEILYHTIITQSRIKTIATKIVSDISQYKRSGSKVSSSALNGLSYQSNSNQWASNFMRQHKFLKQLLKTLKTQPDVVMDELTRIRDTLTKPKHMLVHLTLNKNKFDVSKLPELLIKMIPDEVLKRHSSEDHIDLKDVIHCSQLYQPLDKPTGTILGLGSVESNYMQQVIKSNIDSPLHPDLPALFVLINYLTQLEGPLWKEIRGSGLSYSYHMQISPSDGLLYFSLHKSSLVVPAYKKTIEIIERHLSGEDEFEDTSMDSAKSSLVFDFIRREKSASSRSIMSLLAHIRGMSIEYNRDLIKRVASVTKEDLKRVGPIYLKPLFGDPERRTVVCCHSSKVEEISKGFEDVNCHLDRINLEEDTFMNTIV